MQLTTIANMEALTDWQQPGTVGNDGGGSPTEPSGYSMASGSPAVFTAKPPKPYKDGYFYRTVPGSWNAMTYFEYRMRFMLPTSQDIAGCQAVEFELQQNVGSHIYNMAWEMDLKKTGMWCLFNYNMSQWEPTLIPVPKLIPGQWVDVKANFIRGGDCTLTHLTLRVDGVSTPVNVTREATAKVESDYLNAAFQLDGNSISAPYEMMLLDMGITML